MKTQRLRYNTVRLLFRQSLGRIDRSFTTLDIHGFAPTVLRRPEFLGFKEDVELLKHLYPCLFHDELAFTAMALNAMLIRDKIRSLTAPMSPEVQIYYRKAIVLLRKSLADDKAFLSDTIIMGLSNIIGVDVSLSHERESSRV